MSLRKEEERMSLIKKERRNLFKKRGKKKEKRNEFKER